MPPAEIMFEKNKLVITDGSKHTDQLPNGEVVTFRSSPTGFVAHIGSEIKIFTTGDTLALSGGRVAKAVREDELDKDKGPGFEESRL